MGVKIHNCALLLDFLALLCYTAQCPCYLEYALVMQESDLPQKTLDMSVITNIKIITLELQDSHLGDLDKVLLPNRLSAYCHSNHLILSKLPST